MKYTKFVLSISASMRKITESTINALSEKSDVVYIALVYCI